MTQLRRDAAYIQTQSHERTTPVSSAPRNPFDEQVLQVLGTAHTVKSAAKTLSQPTDVPEAELERRVADSMQRLLQAERIQLSPDS